MDIKSSDDNPGPGGYSPLLKLTNVRVPKYTIQGPTKYDPMRMIPGPGTYNVAGDLGGPTFSMGKRLVQQPFSTPGPGHYNPELSPSSAPSHSMGMLISAYPFLTPGPGTYNIGARYGMNDAPAFTMGQRFVRLRDRPKAARDKRFSAALKQRPHHRSAGSSPATTRPWTRPASPPLIIAPPAKTPRLSWTRPSTWDITAPLVMNPRPRPMTSAENILRRVHFKVGPTQNAQFNEYVREMYRCLGNKGVRYGRVAKWGTATSFIQQSYRNRSFISRREL